jgi:hypothetical protein
MFWLFMPVNLPFRLSLAWLAVVLAAIASPATTRALASDRGDVATPRTVDQGVAAIPATRPMVVVRMRAKDRCGPRCPEWIMAEGTITPDTPVRFRQLLRQIGSEKLPVVLDSSGGDLDAALEIGRIIRSNGLTTIIGRSEVQGCAPRDPVCNEGRRLGLAYAGFVSIPGTCSGACLLVLAAGVQRIGYWIAEAHFPALDSFSTRKAGADAAKLIGTYLADMGVSPGLIPRLRRNSLALSRAEMLHFGLSTGRQRVEDFTGSSICGREVPAANCVAPAVALPSARVSTKPASRKPAAPRSTRVIIWGGIEEM